MNKAIFLDRDGVINNDEGHYYIYKIEDFKINNGIIDSLKELYKNNYLIIIISNQGGISKKIYTKNDVEIIHKHLISVLKNEGIEISEIYYCPHHSDIEKCICRKPDNLLLEKAISMFNIDINNSFFIGDNERDILTAKKTGLKSIKINSNEDISKYIKSIIKVS